MGKYKIANIKIEFNYCFDSYFKNRIDKYKIGDEEKVDVKMNFFVKEAIAFPVLPYERIKNRIIKNINNINHIYVVNETEDIVNIYYQYDENYQDINVYFRNSDSKDLEELEYVISGMMFLNVAIANGIVPLHASAIGYKNEAILFSAPSKTGKSTHVKLWQEYVKDVHIINDDKPLITFSSDDIFAEGSPWSGKSVLNDNVRIPLKAIVFLKQNPNNYIEEINNKDKLTYILKNTQRPSEESLFHKLIDRIDLIIKKIPMFVLNCNISEEAVWTIYHKLYEESSDEN